MADVENLINSLENVFEDSPSINGAHIRLGEQERRLSNVSFESDPGGIHCAKKPSRNIFYSETDLQKDHNLSLTLKNNIDNGHQCATTKLNVQPLRPIAPPRPKSKSSSTDQNNIVIINSDLNSPHILFHNTYTAVDSSHQFFHGSEASTSIPEFATISSTLLASHGITSEAHHISNAPIMTPNIELAGDGFSPASLNCVTMAAKTMSTLNINSTVTATVITMNSSSINMTNNQSSIMSFSAGTGDRTTTGTATKYKKTFWDMLAPSYKTRNEDFKKLFFPNISHTVVESNVTVEGDNFNCSFETGSMPTNINNTSSISILTSPSPTTSPSLKGDTIIESIGSIITDPNNLMNVVASSGTDNVSTNGLNDLAERLIVDYSCALQKEILIQGRMYISQSYLCFYANIFRWESKIKIRFKDIVAINKEKLAKIIPNALTILTNTGAKFTFASFTARDKTYFMLFRIWQKALMDQPIAPNEIWRYVHESYGNELGLTSEDEDYVDPRNNATIVSPHGGSSHYHYHHHPYKKHGGVKSGNFATKILVSPTGKLQSSPGRAHKLSRKEVRAQSPTSLVDNNLDDFTTNHDNSFVGSSVPQNDLIINDHEDDLYFDTDTNLSVCQEAINLGEEAFSDTDLPRFSPLASKQMSGKTMATLRGGRERKTESHDIGGGNMHYGMDDETLTITAANSNTDDIFKNITKTAIFKNNPPLEERTSSGKFTSDDELCYNGDSDNFEGDSVSCLCTNHPGKLYLDVLIHDKSCDDVFTMLFTNSSFFRNLQKERHTRNLVMSEWQRSTESLGQNNNSLGNKGGLHHPHKISGGINKGKLNITSSASYLAKRKKRVLSYVVQISSPIGNKSAPTTEKQTLLIGNEAKRRSTRRHHYRISRRYVVECEVTNSGVPYSDAYYVICRYCITAMVQNNDNIGESKNTTTQSNNKNITNESKKLAKSNVRPLGCRLRVHCLIGYKKSVFSLVKSIIEKNCQSGLQDYFNFLGEKIVHEMRARSISHCVLEQQNMSETKNLPYTQSNNLDRINTPLNYKQSHGELRKSVKSKQSLVKDDLNIQRNCDVNMISEHHQKSLSLDYRRRAPNVNSNDHHGDPYEIPNNTNKLRKGANDKISLYPKIVTFVSTSVYRLRTENICAIVGAFSLKIFFLVVICCYILSLHKRVAYLENIIGALKESKLINQTFLKKESNNFPKQPIIHQTTLFSKPQNVDNIYSYTTFLTDISYWAANFIYQIIEIPFKIYDALRTQYCSRFLSYGDHLRMMELHERLLDKIERMYEKMQSSNSNK